MNKYKVSRRIVEIGVIPVVRAESADMAMRAIEAIKAGGISILEITMTVPDAIRIIEDVARRFDSEAIVGAGTVLDARTAQRCIHAGARFVVGPVLDLDTISLCRREEIVVMPGALTPSEIIRAWSAGADFVKVFPAGSVGGPSYIRALKAPLPQVHLVPTGGVTLKTAADFITAGAVALGVGTDLIDIHVLRERRDHIITERARQYLEVVSEARYALGQAFS